MARGDVAVVLTQSLRRFATSRPHILLLETSGGLVPRLEVERFARLHAWPLVDGPADADLLVVAGAAGEFDPYIDRVWNQLPGPRARVVLAPDDDPVRGLQHARLQLERPEGGQGERRAPGRPAASHAGHDMGAMGGMEMAVAEDPHAGHDMGAMGGMDMPAGLGMADRADDRDGLKLDVLTVPWGPALPWWPAGLVVTTVLQGDVVAEARAERLGDPAGQAGAWREIGSRIGTSRGGAACLLDSLTRLLALAGWRSAHLGAQRVRDDLLGGSDPQRSSQRLHRLADRVAGSRLLAAMTSAIPSTAGGDVRSRYLAWLDAATTAVDQDRSPAWSGDPAAAVEELPGLLVGREFASARLAVASLDPELSGAFTAVAARA